MTKRTRHWASLPAICLAALSILAFSSTADAQWGRDGAVRRPPAYDRGRPNSPAFQNGFDDGYKQGRDDGRDGDRFDVRRHGRYRSGDHGYHGSFGPRVQYKQFYRNGFEQGYDRGYREGQRNHRGPWRRW